MAHKNREFSIDLERDGPNTPWGIRLVGGTDLNTPLIIIKVRRPKVFRIYLNSNF